MFSAPSAFSLDLRSFTLSTLGNLADRSYVTPLQYSVGALTHMRRAYIAGRYGRASGEFRLQVRQARIPAGLFDTGVALRLSI